MLYRPGGNSHTVPSQDYKMIYNATHSQTLIHTHAHSLIQSTLM